ncbi:MULTISPECIES: HNH endonuclease signature motif containing protein [Microbacterium]|uniref:HNH endonuclease signature motif containing protein n=1 Tax=Microbacterium TaxID=33882 RepID=UPI00217E0FB7|nr:MULTISPECIES: HNH endonuclease signature motif containing protein [Microbacterium]UWF77365.1 DUF222 domain-containing protein [Microbacterium neungamense]WCM55527.1 DUF222 domain-containing protein [Microbacterium sp. EF45047]
MDEEEWFEDEPEEPSVPRTAAEVVAFLLDDLTCTDNEANRKASRRAERIVEAVRMARAHPEVYVPHGDPDAARYAERSVILDIGLRLRQSEDQIRHVLWVAETAMLRLPLLWHMAREGFASMAQVTQVVSLTARMRAGDGASAGELEAEAAAFEAVDRAAAEWATTCAPAAFRRQVKTLVERLVGPDTSRRHAQAMTKRHVFITDDENGMSWIGAYLSTVDARAAYRRLTATAKHTQKSERDGRTRDQIRADLFAAWLKGEGTPTAVKTCIYVTIPAQLLAGQPVPAESARIVGGDTIDPLTAKQLFLDAKAFHRVITDPVAGVVLDMDRRTYRPTKAQRDFLILQHGTCARDGCERLAAEADIDHEHPWATGGRTNITDLRPLCPRDHTHRHRTKATYRSRPDRTVQVTTPTGHETRPPRARLTTAVDWAITVPDAPF